MSVYLHGGFPRRVILEPETRPRSVVEAGLSNKAEPLDVFQGPRLWGEGGQGHRRSWRFRPLRPQRSISSYPVASGNRSLRMSATSITST